MLTPLSPEHLGRALRIVHWLSYLPTRGDGSEFDRQVEAARELIEELERAGTWPRGATPTS